MSVALVWCCSYLVFLLSGLPSVTNVILVTFACFVIILIFQNHFSYNEYESIFACTCIYEGKG